VSREKGVTTGEMERERDSRARGVTDRVFFRTEGLRSRDHLRGRTGVRMSVTLRGLRDALGARRRSARERERGERDRLLLREDSRSRRESRSSETRSTLRAVGSRAELDSEPLRDEERDSDREENFRELEELLLVRDRQVSAISRIAE
jgi:hypothetical protein